METKIPSGAAPGNSAPKKKKTVVIIIAVLIALLSVGAIVYFIFSKLKNNGIGLGIPKTTTLKFPDIIPGSTVSKNIPAKTGGQISATNKQGVKITIDIPPGSLKDDTTVTIDPANPNNQDPNNPDPNNPDPNNPGPNNPPGGGGGSQCANPPCNPDNPPDNPPGVPPTLPPFGGFVIGPTTLVFNPSATVTFSYPQGRRMVPGVEIVVSIDRNGWSHVLPTTPSVTGSFTVPIGGGGAIIPDDSSDNGGTGDDNSGGGSSGGTTGGGGSVGDPANNAAIASGGKCTPEFLEAIKGKKKFALGAPGHAAYDAALRDCLDVDKIKEQCANNPIVLRRRHFETRINIANSLDKEVADELKNLMASCVAKYSIENNGSYAESGVVTNVSMGAELCGYVDDEWKVSYSYALSAGAGSGNNCAGTGIMRLPFGGGYFTTGVSCQVRAYVLGHPITLPGGMAITGTFFEPSRVILNLFGMYIVKDTPITLKGKTCIDNVDIPPFTGEPDNSPNDDSEDDLIPLKDIPKVNTPSSSIDGIPLVPIPRH
jgi:uncharacterized membrane protein YgcG